MSRELIKRDSTLRHQYIKGILGKNKLSKKDKIEHYKKYDIDINKCAYCGESANTLDHIFGLVNDKVFSGYTNDISNLLPCCSSCNSSKGKNDWDKWINSKTIPRAIYAREHNKGFNERKLKIENYILKNETEKKKIDANLLKKMNENALEFDKEMSNKLKELDIMFNKHREFFEKSGK